MKNPHDIVRFFIFTYGISWGIWFLAFLVFHGNTTIITGFGIIGAYGPALSMIIITSKKNQAETQNNHKQLKFFFIFLAIILCIDFVLIFTSKLWFSLAPYIIFSSILAAYMFSGIFSKKTQVANHLKNLKGVPGKNGYLLIAILYFFVISFGAFLFALLRKNDYPPDFSWPTFLLNLLSNFYFIFLFGGGNEEFGWRGYALPHLLQKYGYIKSALILGIFWGLWHLPLHIIGFYPDSNVILFITQFSQAISFSVIIMWYYYKSKGNLLGCMLIHTSINAFAAFTTILDLSPEELIIQNLFVNIALMLSFWVIIIYFVRKWRKEKGKKIIKITFFHHYRHSRKIRKRKKPSNEEIY